MDLNIFPLKYLAKLVGTHNIKSTLCDGMHATAWLNLNEMVQINFIRYWTNSRRNRVRI
jgi:hypothetical protein